MGALRRVKLGGHLLILWSATLFLAGCASTSNIYRDPNMDFGALQSVAVMPFENLSRDPTAAGRVRDIFMVKLLSTGAFYVIPPGEIARGIVRAGISNPASPSPEEIIKFAAISKVEGVITGTIREYGEARSGSASANMISLSVSMLESQTGKIVWTASSTKGGVGISDRLFGGGGRPMNDITEVAVDDIIRQLFK